MKSKLELLFQNDSIIAINKPPGLLSVPDRYIEEKPSVAQLVLSTFPTARPLHRLDFETSGVLLFCIIPEAFSWYSDQFEKRTLTKTYHAISEGRFPEDNGIIDQPLLTQTNGKVIISKRGRPGMTHWKVAERFLLHSFLEINPMTGRTHQIRVHLASVGHPIVGDSMYGTSGDLFLSTLKGRKKYHLSKNTEQEHPLISRTALHASGIKFSDFSSGKEISVECPLPKDMNVTLIKLRQYSSIAQGKI